MRFPIELGVATSGATFFRSIGGSFGVAIFGAIFSNALVGNLVRHLGTAKLPTGLSSSSVTPAILDKLPPAVHHGVSAAYAESIQTVFVIAAPIGLIAFLASWFIPQVELRRGVGAAPAPSSGRPDHAIWYCSDHAGRLRCSDEQSQSAISSAGSAADAADGRVSRRSSYPAARTAR